MKTKDPVKAKYFSCFAHFVTVNVLFLTVIFTDSCGSSLCPNFNFVPTNAKPIEESALDVKTDINIGNYSCPGDTNPKRHTECCSELGMRGCCPKRRYFYEIDPTVASVIAISVTLGGIVFTIAVAICCFSSYCPLYSACREEFTAEIPSYASKEDAIDMDTMPSEISGKGGNKFSPIVVSNGNLALDADNNPV